MFCPVDGVEFIEGITRCPEHDVDLVEEPPELPERLLDYDLRALRVVFGTLVVAAIVYAVTGGAAGALVALDPDSSDFNRFRSLTEISGAAFKIAVGAFGVVAGAVLLRVYTKERAQAALDTEPENETSGDEQKETRRSWRVSSIDIMRVLFVLTVAFTLMWVTTGVLTAHDASDFFYRTFPPNAEASDGPSQTFITLSTLNTVAYYGGAACLAIMGAWLVLVAYVRVRAGRL